MWCAPFFKLQEDELHFEALEKTSRQCQTALSPALNAVDEDNDATLSPRRQT